MTDSLQDNTARQRYELDVGGELVFASYRRADGRLIITHVEAPPQLRGTGAADRFMRALVATVRASGEKIVPRCGYAAGWLQRHPENADIMG